MDYCITFYVNWWLINAVLGLCVCFSSVLCRVYVTIDSYVSVKMHSEVCVQELLNIVAERLDCAEDDMVLMAVTYPGGLNKFIRLSVFILSAL